MTFSTKESEYTSKVAFLSEARRKIDYEDTSDDVNVVV